MSKRSSIKVIFTTYVSFVKISILKDPIFLRSGSFICLWLTQGITEGLDEGYYKDPIVIKPSDMSITQLALKTGNGKRIYLNLESPQIIEHIGKLRSSIGLNSTLEYPPHITLSYREDLSYKFPSSRITLPPLRIIGHRVFSSNYADDNYDKVRYNKMIDYLERKNKSK